MSSSWLYIAFGISAALLIIGAFAIITAQAELASGKRTVTMVGKVAACRTKSHGLVYLAVVQKRRNAALDSWEKMESIIMA
ncbi:hypothetical protein Ngar_c32530 [Candidatus Nitrososphaera gargensis Ga9.2]|uniref:Uncharacterized protein n=1 Tax=Nitrososphaera gargensis (strain Ga9.2) TaxID=1237085 RepID=K0IL63_NITGG|nr:hypothetical protein Ngar_c32530 [Candidatus Nitrososphaera gargensis Ga9.2]